MLISPHRMSQRDALTEILNGHGRARTRDLPRVLGASQATAIVVGTIIGSGIFLVPPAIFVACAGAVLVYSYAGNLKGSLLGTGLILLGLPVLWGVRRVYPYASAGLEGISK